MAFLTLQAIADVLGGEVSGHQVLAPTPGHSKRDRGTAVRIAPGAPDGVLVTCYNGSQAEALAVKDMLRSAGLLPEWSGKRRVLTHEEQQVIRRAAEQQEVERRARWQAAALTARLRLAQAVPADPGHPYLVAKRIASERLWQAGARLLVPMQDEMGEVQNVQSIAPDGSKLFTKGGRTSGLFWWVGKATDRLVIGEGMATVAAIRRATGVPVVAAMTAHNLPKVAQAIHAKRPDLELIIAADDDPAGHEAASSAAALTGASIVFPELTE
ncbi:toprim domain-containing protein [Novosphingobium sp.]|uniref:toprim domain-containing protein n=1 Tax=Novosphingobium sp. TaxID=1874826 RepID=UPI0026220891|nr:toprim domain-containing protein [Novosphingobium sp.]